MNTFTKNCENPSCVRLKLLSMALFNKYKLREKYIIRLRLRSLNILQSDVLNRFIIARRKVLDVYFMLYGPFEADHCFWHLLSICSPASRFGTWWGEQSAYCTIFDNMEDVCVSNVSVPDKHRFGIWGRCLLDATR